MEKNIRNITSFLMCSQKMSWDLEQQALDFQKWPVTSAGPSELSTPGQDLLVSFALLQHVGRCTAHYGKVSFLWKPGIYQTSISMCTPSTQDLPDPLLFSKIQTVKSRKINWKQQQIEELLPLKTR